MILQGLPVFANHAIWSLFIYWSKLLYNLAMLSITHMAVGASLATSLNHPGLYIPAALLSHYLLDGILHWDCGTGLGTGRKTKKMALFHEIIELILSFGYLLILDRSTPGFDLHLWLAALVSILPDLIEAPENFLAIRLKFLNPLNDFHAKFHRSTPDMITGLTPQLIALFLIYLLV